MKRFKLMPVRFSVSKSVLVVLSILFFLASCNGYNRCAKIGEFEWFDEGPGYSREQRLGIFTLDATVSLQTPEQMVQTTQVGGKFFCIETKAGKNELVFEAPAKDVVHACFQLTSRQVFKGETKYWQGSPPDEVIDPNQFLKYYSSIPKELNKFLAIRVFKHNKILTASEIGEPPFTSPAYLFSNGNYGLSGSYRWSGLSNIDASSIYLPQALHSFAVTEEDSWIYIYLPLNIGIKTPEYAGVLPTRDASSKVRDFNNPNFRLSPDFKHPTTTFGSLREFDYCNAYSDIAINTEVRPEMLTPSLQSYKEEVRRYLAANPGATFPDPYATSP